MLLDASLAFVPMAAPLSLVLGAGVSQASAILDLLGQGVGNAPGNIIGTRALFGADIGIGKEKAMLICAIGTAFATANSATLNVQFQGAVDTGAAGSYQPGAWNTFVETGVISAANLAAGKIIARFDFPPAFPVNVLPRYLRLNFSIQSGTNFTAGTIAYAYPTMARDDWSAGFAAKNFAVS